MESDILKYMIALVSKRHSAIHLPVSRARLGEIAVAQRGNGLAVGQGAGAADAEQDDSLPGCGERLFQAPLFPAYCYYMLCCETRFRTCDK